jgi:hypothetical protein
MLTKPSGLGININAGRRRRGIGEAYINGVMIPSTPDPVGTPIVWNPAPGQNLQTQPTVYTGPQGGYSCNVAGGYTMRRPSCWLTDQCMSDSDYASAQAACGGAVVQTSNDPIILAPNTAPSSAPQPILTLNPTSIGIPTNPTAPIAPPIIISTPAQTFYAPPSTYTPTTHTPTPYSNNPYTPPSPGTTSYTDSTGQTTAGVSNSAGLVNGNGDIIIGGFDASTFLANNWMYLAGGVVALVLLTRK